MEAKDLDVQVMAEGVAISSERKSEVKEKTRSEFRYGKFALSHSSTRKNSKHQRHSRLQRRNLESNSSQVGRRKK